MTPHEQAWLQLTDEVTVRDQPTYRSSEGADHALQVGECNATTRAGRPSVDPRALVRGQRVRFVPGDGEQRVLDGVFDSHGYCPDLLRVVPELGSKASWWVHVKHVVSVGEPPDGRAPAAAKRRRK